MDVIDPRICGTRLPQHVYCLIGMSEKQITNPQGGIRAVGTWIARIEPDGFLELRDRCLRLTHEHQRVGKLKNCARIVSVERYRRLQLDLRFRQPLLHPAEPPERVMRHRAVRIALESFYEQPLGARLILLSRAAPSVAYTTDQNLCETDPRIDGSRVHFQ